MKLLVFNYKQNDFFETFLDKNGNSKPKNRIKL